MKHAQAVAYQKRQKNLAKIPTTPTVPTRVRPENGGKLRKVKPTSDVKHALRTGERVYKRYAKGNHNILTGPADPHSVFQNRPFPYGSLQQVENVNYTSLANDVLKRLSKQYGGKTSKAMIGSAKLLPSVYGPSGYAYVGSKGVYVSPGAAVGVFSGNGSRDFALKIPVHEYAHTRQRPSLGKSTRLTEGGADLFMRAVAPALYKSLGISVSDLPSNPDYQRYARTVQKKGGLKYVLGKQFR